jgi:hypothetical protein
MAIGILSTDEIEKYAASIFPIACCQQTSRAFY